MAGRVAADRAAAVDLAVGDPAAAELAAADKVGGRGRVATDPHLTALGPEATDRHLIDLGQREATDRRSTDPGAKATVRRSIARGLPPTVPRLIARGGTARRRLIARGVTIGRLQRAPGKLIGPHLTARAANFGLSLIDLAEILARRKSAARDTKDHRATDHGRSAHDVTPDRRSTVLAAAAAAAAAGLTRIVRGGLAPMADAIGHRVIRADHRARSRHARYGLRTSTRASSWVKVTS